MYWKDNDSKTVWNLSLKFCAKFGHKKKFIYNKDFVVCCSIVTFIKIFMGGIFLCHPTIIEKFVINF